jgi:hypothetical protein
MSDDLEQAPHAANLAAELDGARLALGADAGGPWRVAGAVGDDSAIHDFEVRELSPAGNQHERVWHKPVGARVQLAQVGVEGHELDGLAGAVLDRLIIRLKGTAVNALLAFAVVAAARLGQTPNVSAYSCGSRFRAIKPASPSRATSTSSKGGSSNGRDSAAVRSERRCQPTSRSLLKTEHQDFPVSACH